MKSRGKRNPTTHDPEVIPMNLTELFAEYQYAEAAAADAISKRKESRDALVRAANGLEMDVVVGYEGRDYLVQFDPDGEFPFYVKQVLVLSSGQPQQSGVQQVQQDIEEREFVYYSGH